MARTTSAAVILVLGGDYDTVSLPSVTPYIDSATAIVDRVNAAATVKGYILSTVELELIERWLSAHLYTKSDPTYQSRSTAGASGSFVRGPKEPEPYKDAAIAMDPSGCLNSQLNALRAGGFWLGKPPSAQIPYKDRS